MPVTRSRAELIIWLLAAAWLLAGCGADRSTVGRIRGTTLTIFMSGPSQGASSADAQSAWNGAQMALASIHSRIGRYHVVLRQLDDATPQSDGWDPNQTTTNVRLVIQNPTTIGYVGDFNSGASAISIPPLNRAGIPQISPASSAVGLTSAGPGASPGEPEKYYPAGTRTFARVVPSDAVQAATLVRVQQQMGCTRTFVLQDGEVDGEDAAFSFVLTAKSAGLRVIGVQAFPRRAPSYSALASSVAASGADCVLISAIDERSAVLLTEDLAQALPRAPIFATSGLADSTYIDPAEGGIPGSLDGRVVVVSPTLEPSAYPPSGRAFLTAYEIRFGPPEPSAIFGYEAMSLMLDAVARATDRGRKEAERAKVVAAIMSTRNRRSVLGTYSIDPNGDTTIDSYGTYRIVDGTLAPLAGIR